MLLKFRSKAVAFGLYDILFWQARNHLSPPSPAPSFMVLLTYTKLRSIPLFIFMPRSLALRLLTLMASRAALSTMALEFLEMLWAVPALEDITHQQYFKLLEVVDQEFLEATGPQALCFLVAPLTMLDIKIFGPWISCSPCYQCLWVSAGSV